MLIDYPKREAELGACLEEIISSQKIDISEVLRHWPAYIKRRTLPRFLAHYELFKKVINLPGSIVELGVYRGASFFTWANLLETFFANDRTRKVYGFDHFEGLRPEHFSEEYDGIRDGRDGKSDWAYKTAAEPIRKLVSLHNEDNLLPGIERCVLVEGDVFESVPSFLAENPGLRINLLYFDLDLYEPTKFCLEKFYPLLVRGGILCLDEYGLIPWEGESKAVEEFFAPELPKLHKFPFSPSPGAYIFKR